MAYFLDLYPTQSGVVKYGIESIGNGAGIVVDTR